MKKKALLPILLLVITPYIAGCETTSQTESEMSVVLPPPADVEVSRNDLTLNVAYRNSDGIFELSGTDDGLTSFTVNRDRADIRDLASFSSCLYRRELAPKFKECKKL